MIIRSRKSTEDEANLLRTALKSASESEEAPIVDILTNMFDLEVDADMLKTTLIGKAVSKTQLSFKDKEGEGATNIRDLCDKLLNKWRTIFAQSKAPSSSSSSSSSLSATTEVIHDNSRASSGGSTLSSSSSSSSSSSTMVSVNVSAVADYSTSTDEGSPRGGGANSEIVSSLNIDDIPEYKKLPEHRKKIVNMMSDYLKADGCDDETAKYFSFIIENAIVQLFDPINDRNGYMEKAKVLSQNLKTNSQLRQRVLDMDIKPEVLVKLSVKELSSQELAARRSKIASDSMEARRTDVADVARQKTFSSLGVDTNKGDTRCKRCKGFNINITFVQTRSSDEPMTQFCSCSDCKFKWRS